MKTPAAKSCTVIVAVRGDTNHARVAGAKRAKASSTSHPAFAAARAAAKALGCKEDEVFLKIHGGKSGCVYSASDTFSRGSMTAVEIVAEVVGGSQR